MRILDLRRPAKMLPVILSSLAFATSAFAAPLAVPSSSFPTLVTRDNSNDFNITYRSPRSSEYDSLPKLLILATGEFILLVCVYASKLTFGRSRRRHHCWTIRERNRLDGLHGDSWSFGSTKKIQRD